MKRLIKQILFLHLIFLLSCNYQKGENNKNNSEIGINDNSIKKVDQGINYDSIIDEKVSKYKTFPGSPLTRVVPEIGDRYIDFKAVNKEGVEISLSDIQGKFILLNFTTSYCGGCRKSIPELRLINKKLQESLDIVSFYTDSFKKDWLNSIKRDSVTWINLWDGQGANSVNCYNYGITGYPTYFLINKKGKIIDKWSGYISCESLDKKIQDNINN
jgi:thiol-disulfide isomerase/thioredoxin